MASLEEDEAACGIRHAEVLKKRNWLMGRGENYDEEKEEEEAEEDS